MKSKTITKPTNMKANADRYNAKREAAFVRSTARRASALRAR